MKKIILDFNDLKCLISGGILTVKTDYNEIVAEIACSDISFPYISDFIHSLMMNEEKLYQHREKLL